MDINDFNYHGNMKLEFDKIDKITLPIGTILIILYIISYIIPNEFTSLKLSLHLITILSMMMSLGFFIGLNIVNRVNRKKKTGDSIGRPLEFIFFTGLFSSTLLFSMALENRPYDTISYYTFFTLSMGFYALAVTCGIGHYIKKIYN